MTTSRISTAVTCDGLMADGTLHLALAPIGTGYAPTDARDGVRATDSGTGAGEGNRQAIVDAWYRSELKKECRH
jgi:hypothetical protein